MTLDRRLVIEALPNYEIGDEIGRGGWGVVLAGRHRELGRAVAIKQLPRAFAADPTVRSRFKDEARLIASLDHPHIVPVYDFVESEGLCLIVMELMPGGTLWERFTSTGLPIDQACAQMLAASAALDLAHRRGILHRDVKPENFLFSAGGVMKLGDFGIAKLLDAAAGHTLTGQIIGTPAYMAPEQAAGEPVGPFTDVYACAVMLYELLTGELPFVETREPLGQLMQRLTQPPTPIATTRPDVPREIADTVMTALARQPGDRFPTAAAFGESLARAATVAFGPGWLMRSGVEVLGAPGLVAITSAPIEGAGTAAPIAKRTVRPTTMHVRVDDIVVVEGADPGAGLPAAPSAPPTPPPSPPPLLPPTSPSSPPPTPPPTPVPLPTLGADPYATMAPQAYEQAAASHAPTTGAPGTSAPTPVPTPPHVSGGLQPPGAVVSAGAPAAGPHAPGPPRRTGAVAIVAGVVVLAAATAGFLAVRARSTTAGGGNEATGGMAISSVADNPGSGANAHTVTWSDVNDRGVHYLYAVGPNFSTVTASSQSPTTVVLPDSGPACFVLTRANLTDRSAPNCINQGTPDLVPKDLR